MQSLFTDISRSRITFQVGAENEIDNAVITGFDTAIYSEHDSQVGLNEFLIQLATQQFQSDVEPCPEAIVRTESSLEEIYPEDIARTERGLQPSASTGMVGPTQQGLQPPASTGALGPTERQLRLQPPASTGALCPSERGLQPPASTGVVGPTQQGLQPPASAGELGPSERGLRPSATTVLVGPTERVLRPPVLAGVVGLLTNSIFLLRVFVDKAIAITRDARGTDFNDISVGIFTLHGNNFRCQFVYHTFIHAYQCSSNTCLSMHINAYQCLSMLIYAFQCSSKFTELYLCLNRNGTYLSMRVNAHQTNAFQCISTFINAYQCSSHTCSSMHINAYQCLSMLINAFQCSSNEPENELWTTALE